MASGLQIGSIDRSLCHTRTKFPVIGQLTNIYLRGGFNLLGCLAIFLSFILILGYTVPDRDKRARNVRFDDYQQMS